MLWRTEDWCKMYTIALEPIYQQVRDFKVSDCSFGFSMSSLTMGTNAETIRGESKESLRMSFLIFVCGHFTPYSRAIAISPPKWDTKGLQGTGTPRKTKESMVCSGVGAHIVFYTKCVQRSLEMFEAIWHSVWVVQWGRGAAFLRLLVLDTVAGWCEQICIMGLHSNKNSRRDNQDVSRILCCSCCFLGDFWHLRCLFWSTSLF